MPHVHGMLCSSLLSLFTLNTTRTSLFNFVAIQFGLSRPDMIKSINQNTNIEKRACSGDITNINMYIYDKKIP